MLKFPDISKICVTYYYKRHHLQHFFYFIPYKVRSFNMIYVIRCQHTLNLISSINLIIAKNEFKRQYAKPI